ncbi:hypothetical protein MAP00_008696 [Monascus purpureus]|nr:hypothetical protein MAP00_008696 [Monascus purpureus]
MEKLENEKVVIEQQNQFLLQRLAQMEAENNRLSQQVARLSAEIHGSSSSQVSDSPTLTATLFKQDDDIPLERVPFPTPSDSPIIHPSSLAESSDMTQHPAAVLCDLQCQSLDSKEKRAAFQAFNLMLQMTLQLLFLMMTSTAYSTVIHPLLQNLHSLKMYSSLTSSTEIYQPFPLILSLISTPKNRPSVLRTRLLTRLLACSPALARPLRDATGKALQLAVNKHFSQYGMEGITGLQGVHGVQGARLLTSMLMGERWGLCFSARGTC